LARLRDFGAEAVMMDLMDAASVRRAMGKPDIVINLSTHVPDSTARFPWSWRENDRVRRVGSANLATAARLATADCVIQESFAPVYEDHGDEWIDERWRLNPARHNKTVLDAEAAVAQFTKFGGRGIVLRFAYFYGADSPLTRRMLDSVKRGVSPLVGSPDAYYPTVSHDDAAAAVVEAIHLPAGTYNVVDDQPLTRGDWLESLSKALGVALPRARNPWPAPLDGGARELRSRSQRVSNRKLRELTGWQPTAASIREAWPAVLEQSSELAQSR
jgi:nucleoside-diphosphate-sugar epimerase